MISHGKDIKIFTGNANPTLAVEICKIIGTKLGESEVKSFADGECSVSLYETVRGSDVFLVQSTCKPVSLGLSLGVIGDFLYPVVVAVSVITTFLTPYMMKAALPAYTHPLLRLCPSGPQGQVPRPHLLQARRQHARCRRRGPRADDGPARRADPGLL